MNFLLGLVPSLVDLVKKYIPDRAAQDAAIAEINQTVNEAAAKLGEAMLIDAKSSSKFQSWWRPGIGWICTFGLGLHFLFFPLVGIAYPELLSPLDLDSLMPLVLTLLGMSGLRTVEKIKK